MERKDVVKILDLMMEAELSLAALYKTCADIWPEDSGFWTELAGEEHRHADSIKKMITLLSDQAVSYSLQRPFQPVALKTFIAGIHENTQTVLRRAIDKKRALGISKDIENSIIENRFFEIVRCANVEYQNLVKEIREQTVQHRARIVKRLEQLPKNTVR